jgi:rubrerythrin
MSISMECFESHGHFATYDAYRAASGHLPIFEVMCHFCGYEASDSVVPPSVCPKCNAASWERSPRPGSILSNAQRHVA